MKKLFVALFLIPLTSLAAPPASGGPSADDGARFDRMEQRMRTSRGQGLVETLALDDAGAARLRETLGQFDDRRKPLLRDVHDGMIVLRDAASGGQTAQKQVDAAVQRVFEARGKVEALDREMYQEVTKDLSAEKRARAAVFLASFQGRFGMGMGPGGRGGGRGMGMGTDGRGGGPGMGDCSGPSGGMGPGRDGMRRQ